MSGSPRAAIGRLLALAVSNGGGLPNEQRNPEAPAQRAPTPAALAEDQARDIINRWSGAGFFRLRNMGDKIFIDTVTPGTAYTIRLQTHYEQRKVKRVSEPFHGGPVDDRGRPPDQWEIPVPRPGAFEERTEVLPIPHTERVQMCPACAGEGRVSCPRCMGQGRMPCPWCGGTGMVERQVMDTGRDAQGNVISMPRVVHSRCSCSGGQVVCTQCAGNRVLRCPSCAGSGKVKTLDQLVVRFQTATQGELLDITPVPDRWLGQLSGEILVDERARHLEGCGSVPDAVAQKAGDLLAKSHVVDERQSRIILQLLQVERIPLHEVRYMYAGVDRQLWICGTEQQIYAPNAPWNRSRLAWLIAGSVLAAAVVLGLLFYLSIGLERQPSEGGTGNKAGTGTFIFFGDLNKINAPVPVPFPSVGGTSENDHDE